MVRNMTKDLGCLSVREYNKLKKTAKSKRPKITIFLVRTNGRIISRPAKDWYFTGARTRYYKNYLLAYGYLLRIKKQGYE